LGGHSKKIAHGNGEGPKKVELDLLEGTNVASSGLPWGLQGKDYRRKRVRRSLCGIRFWVVGGEKTEVGAVENVEKTRHKMSTP